MKSHWKTGIGVALESVNVFTSRSMRRYYWRVWGSIPRCLL